MPNMTGRFHLYSGTSKFATGSALYQMQNDKPKLITYASKRLPEATRNYSTTELELCGLAINIASFSNLIKRVDFDVVTQCSWHSLCHRYTGVIPATYAGPS